MAPAPGSERGVIRGRDQDGVGLPGYLGNGGAAPPAGEFLGLGQGLGVHIRNGDNGISRLAEEIPHRCPHLAQTDDADAVPVLFHR